MGAGQTLKLEPYFVQEANCLLPGIHPAEKNPEQKGHVDVLVLKKSYSLVFDVRLQTGAFLKKS